MISLLNSLGINWFYVAQKLPSCFSGATDLFTNTGKKALLNIKCLFDMTRGFPISMTPFRFTQRPCNNNSNYYYYYYKCSRLNFIEFPDF